MTQEEIKELAERYIRQMTGMEKMDVNLNELDGQDLSMFFDEVNRIKNNIITRPVVSRSVKSTFPISLFRGMVK